MAEILVEDGTASLTIAAIGETKCARARTSRLSMRSLNSPA